MELDDQGLVLHEPDSFFTPIVWSPAQSLLDEYALVSKRIRQLADLMATEIASVLGYFRTGNTDPDRRHSESYVRSMFDFDGAMAAANADFWKRALDMTDIYSVLPQPRRDAWNKQFREMKCPEFNEDNLRATLEAFEADRTLFLAERVDGIFRALSGEHVTNRPEGFGKRMILAYVYGPDGYLRHGSREGNIHDLRCVVAKFMGREDPCWSSTNDILRKVRTRTGKWWAIDGGALRIRVYMVGTAHLEVHPEMAWRLNAVLAHLHPLAIPANARQKPKKKAREWAAIQRPLPAAVLAVIADSDGVRHDRGGTEIRLRHYTANGFADKHVHAEVGRVLEMIGGVDKGRGVFQFDYSPFDVIAEIITSGRVPDQKTHQFYPTPEQLARTAIDMAGIEPHHSCLEPSAGVGALASLMPPDTLCVEISALHAKVLESKGLRVECGDFLAFAEADARKWDRIVMNPPFSQGRAEAHVRAAARLLAPGGRLVAILPASMRGSAVVEGMPARWSEVFANEFAGTSVSVAIYVTER